MLTEELTAVAEIAARATLIVLLGLSVLSIGIIVERWLWFRRRRTDLPRVSRALERHLAAGKTEEAVQLLRGEPGVDCQVVADALSWFGRGPDAFAEIVEHRLREKRRQLDGGRMFLGTLGNNAPFIGLFGTVLGVVTAFAELGSSAARAGEMTHVMNGIAEALVATALGILVALPAVIAYNVLDRRAAEVEENALALANLVKAHMVARPEAA